MGNRSLQVRGCTYRESTSVRLTWLHLLFGDIAQHQLLPRTWPTLPLQAQNRAAMDVGTEPCWAVAAKQQFSKYRLLAQDDPRRLFFLSCSSILQIARLLRNFVFWSRGFAITKKTPHLPKIAAVAVSGCCVKPIDLANGNINRRNDFLNSDFGLNRQICILKKVVTNNYIYTDTLIVRTLRFWRI